MIIKIDDDLDLLKIVNSGQCFRPALLSDGSFRFITGEQVLYMRPLGNCDYDISCSHEDWLRVWVPYFDLDRDYAAMRAAIPSDDPFMKKAAAAGIGIRILRQDPFETLISFIISQRKNIPAIRSCVEKVCSIYGRKINTGREEINLFPTPSEIMEKGPDGLCECSLGYRLSYVSEAAEAAAHGDLDLTGMHALSDEALLERLMALKGVGIKVASCVALFAYGRGAIAPVDTWIARVIESEYKGKSPFPGYGERGGLFQQFAFYIMTNPS